METPSGLALWMAKASANWLCVKCVDSLGGRDGVVSLEAVGALEIALTGRRTIRDGLQEAEICGGIRVAMIAVADPYSTAHLKVAMCEVSFARNDDGLSTLSLA